MAAHAFAAVEYLLEETYLPAKWLAYKHSSLLAIIGESRACNTPKAVACEGVCTLC